jgi:hypothetical protein
MALNGYMEISSWMWNLWQVLYTTCELSGVDINYFALVYFLCQTGYCVICIK